MLSWPLRRELDTAITKPPTTPPLPLPSTPTWRTPPWSLSPGCSPGSTRASWKGFPTKHGVMIHQRSCGSFECFLCEATFISSKELKTHMKSDHKTLSDSPVSWFKPILWLNKIELTPLAVLLLVKWMSLLQQWLCLETTRCVGIGNSTCPVLMWRVMDYYCKPCHILRINILSFSYAFFLYANLSPNYCCKPCNISHI